MQIEQIKILQNKQKLFFHSGKTKEIAFRVESLKKLKKIIALNESKIMKALFEDLHKSPTESYTSEIGYLLNEIDYFIKNINNWSKSIKVKTSMMNQPAKSYIQYEPYGTVLIISPWNYPFGLLLTPIIGAIAAGNCVIAKPSESSLRTSQLIYNLISENFDEEYISIIEGDSEITKNLINENIQYIFFTGSSRVGKEIMKCASEHLIPVTLELGGKNPCIVDSEVNMEVTVKRIVWGKFFNAGQTCIAPDYLLVHCDIKEQFINKIIDVVNEFYSENITSESEFSHIINDKHFDRLVSLLAEGKILIGGKSDKGKLFISPTVMTDIQENSDLIKHEIFGPILPILFYSNLESELTKLNKKEKPLCIYFFSKNKMLIDTVINNTSSGSVCINGTIHSIISRELPFGGVGNSGMGKYHGKFSFETFSHKKSILKKSFIMDMKVLYPPYNTPLKLIKKALKVLY